jgi:hypothetical protein
MKLIKELFSGALGIVIVVVILVVSTLLLVFGLRVATAIYPIIINVTEIALSVCIFILLPLALFKKTKIVSVYGLYFASFIFGAAVWIFSFLITYSYWGIFGVILGLFIAGVGVIPLGFVAALLHANWSVLINIVIGVIFTYGARALAMYWAEKIDHPDDQSIDIIEAPKLAESTQKKLKTEGEINKRLLTYFASSYLLYLFVNNMTKRIQYEAWTAIDYVWKPISELFMWALVFCVVVGIYNAIKNKKFAPNGFKDLLASSYKLITLSWIALLIFFFVRYVIF